MKNLLLILSVLLSLYAFCQPSDATIKKDLTNSNKVSIKFTKTTGTRQWNSSTGNWEYVRGVEITQKAASYPEFKIVVIGDAVYQSMGGSSYSYWKFRQTDQHYLDIPNPSTEEIYATISKDWKQFYGYNFRNITNLVVEPKIKEESKFVWHDPKSVSIEMIYTAEIINGWAVEKKEINKTMRLYKDDVNGDWVRFIMSNGPETVLEKTEYHEEEIKELRLKTLEYSLEEEKAKAHMNELPEVEIPKFEKFIDLFNDIHEILLSGDEKKLEAVLIQTLSKKKYLEVGSDVQLNYFGRELVDKITKDAFGYKYKYADQICRTYTFGDLSSERHVNINGSVPGSGMMMNGVLVPGGFKNGVQQWIWEITLLQVFILQDKKSTDYINSFDDPSKLCPND